MSNALGAAAAKVKSTFSQRPVEGPVLPCEKPKGALIVVGRHAEDDNPVTGAPIDVTGTDPGSGGTGGELGISFLSITPGPYKVKASLDGSDAPDCVLQPYTDTYTVSANMATIVELFVETRWISFKVLRHLADGTEPVLPGLIVKIKRESDSKEMVGTTDDQGVAYFKILDRVDDPWTVVEIDAPNHPETTFGQHDLKRG